MNKFEYFEFLEKITKEAGKIVRKGYFGEVESREKNPQDFVTEFDLEVEKFLKEKIKEKFPTHSILAEESGENKENSEYKWIIDPIDGTTNFIHKIPMCAISIALEFEGEVIAGVVYNPITDELFYAEKGKEAVLKTGGKMKILKVKSNPKIEEWFLGWCFPDSKRNSEVVRHIFNALYPKCLRVSKLGSAAIELVYIASNRIDAYVSIGLKQWDYAAGKLIVEETGGFVSKEEFRGENLIIAASKENVERIRKEIG